MIIGLIIVLALILILPFAFQKIEHNLEYFLLIMGVIAAIISGTLSFELILHILENYLLYLITAAVLIAGLIFRVSVQKIRNFVLTITRRIPLSVFIFLIIVVLGLMSSLITAIISALILVEIINALHLEYSQKVKLTVIACFSIGLGAALTPIGEPLSTIVVSSLKADFFYLMNNIGLYVIPCILVLGFLGAFYIRQTSKNKEEAGDKNLAAAGELAASGEMTAVQTEDLKSVFIRAFKIFLFIIALELLGSGFKPLINNYIVHLDSRLLYWINMSSAVLDNATIAAAEVSPVMNLKQIQAILIGLLLSGGMLIPGNIPNIISAGKLNIKSREWAKTGIPLGLALLIVYFVIIFII